MYLYYEGDSICLIIFKEYIALYITKPFTRQEDRKVGIIKKCSYRERVKYFFWNVGESSKNLEVNGCLRDAWNSALGRLGAVCALLWRRQDGI